MFAKVTQIKVMVRKEDQDQQFKFKPNRSDDVQELMTMVCKTWYADKKGIMEIRLCYDDDSQEVLDPNQKLANLKNLNLICKKAVTEKGPETKVDSTTNIGNGAASNGNTNTQKNENGKSEQNKVLQSNDTTTKSDETIADKNRYAVLVGRTGSGKSLLGCALIDQYGDAGFLVSHDPDSCTKVTEYKTNVKRNIAVHDTKGFFDTDKELEKDYKDGDDTRKLQIINEIMDAFETLTKVGIHAILLVVRMGRLDERDKEIIDHLAKYLFEDGMKKKVYLIFTDSPEKYVNNKQKGIKWLDEQCQKPNSILNKYYEVVDRDWNKVFFVDNKNPLDAVDSDDEANVQTEKQSKAKKNNEKMACGIVESLHKYAKDKVYLQKIYNQLQEDYSKLTKPKDKKEFFEKKVLPTTNGEQSQSNSWGWCTLL